MKSIAAVRFGDHFVLNGRETITISEAQIRRFRPLIIGNLSGVGGLDKTVYFQEGPVPKPGEDCDTSWKDYFGTESDNVFELLPKLSCKRQIKFHQIRNQEMSETEPEALKKLKKAKQKANEKMEKEASYNRMTYAKMMGKEVHYGDQIQLYHLRSESFLDSKKIDSKVSQVARPVFLSSELKYTMRFIFEPRFKIHQNGEVVSYGDQIYIKNAKSNSFLEVAGEPLPKIQTLIKGRVPVYQSLHPQVNLRMNSGMFCSKTACLYSLSTGFVWKLVQVPFSDGDEKIIQGNEYVYLQHTEHSAYLSAQAQSSDFSNVYLRKYVGELHGEEISVQSIWQIQNVNQKAKERFGHLKVTHKNLVLRNYLTGQVLCVDDEEALTCKYFHPKESDPHSAYLQFQSLNKSGDKLIRENEIFSIIHIKSDLMLVSSAKNERGFLIDQPVDEQIKKKLDPDEDCPLTDHVHGKFFKKMTSEDDKVKILMADLEQKPEFFDEGFKIIRVPNNEMTMILTIESSFKSILEVVTSFKYKLDHRLSLHSITEAKSALIGLAAFVVDVPFEEYRENNAYSSVPFRQKLMKDMKVIELLTEFVYLPFSSGIYSARRISEFPLMHQAIKSAYALLMLIVKKYSPNEIYTTQWLGLFIHQSSYTHGENCIGAQEMLTILFNDNKPLLNFVDQDIIRRIVEVLRHKIQDEIYINLANSLIICKGKPFEWNQDILTEFLITEGIYEQYVHLDLSLGPNNEPRLNVSGTIMSFVEFNTVYKMTRDQRYNYFKETISLLANLCSGRNFKAMMPLRRLIPLNYCLAVIDDPHIDYSIRKNFLRLVFALYIDDRPLQVIYPRYLRFMKHTRNGVEQSFETPGNTSDKEEELKTFKKMVLNNLEKLTGNGVVHMHNQPVNKFILQLLVAIKKLTGFGQFSLAEEIESLHVKLIDLLDGSNDTYDEFQAKKTKLALIQNQSRASARYAEEILKKMAGARVKRKNKGKEQRYDSNLDELVISIKLETIKILKKLQKIKRDIWLTSYINFFRFYYPAFYKFQNQEEMGSKMPKLDMRKIKEYIGVLAKIDEDFLSQQPLVWVGGVLTHPQFDCLKKLPCILLDLMMYNSPKLVTSAFQLLEMQFMKSSVLLEDLKNVFIVEEEELYKTVVEINEITRDLDNIADKCHLWIRTPESAKWLDALVKLHLVLKGVPVSGANLNISNVSGLPVSASISKAYDEYYVLRDSKDFSKYLVKLFIFKKGQSSLIRILKYSHMRKAQNRLMSKCQLATYNTLILLASKNKRLQTALMEYQDVILCQINSVTNVNAHLLLRAVIENSNKIQDIGFVNNVLDRIINAVNEIISKSFSRASSIFSVAESCLKLGDTPVKHNQTAFMVKISNFPSLLFLLDNTETIEALQRALQKETSRFKSWLYNAQELDPSKKHYHEVSHQVSYFNTSFYLLALACEGFNSASESIGKKCYNLSSIQHMIDLTIGLPYSKRHVWRFFYNCYLGRVTSTDGTTRSCLTLMMEPFLIELQRTCEAIAEIVNDHSVPYGQMYIADQNGLELLESVIQTFFTTTVCPILSEVIMAGFWQPKQVVKEELAKRVLGILQEAKRQLLSIQNSSVVMNIIKMVEFIYENFPSLKDFKGEALQKIVHSRLSRADVNSKSSQSQKKDDVDIILENMGNLPCMQEYIVLETPRRKSKSRLSVFGTSSAASFKRNEAERIAEALSINVDGEGKLSVRRATMMRCFKRSIFLLENPRKQLKTKISEVIQNESILMMDYIENIKKNAQKLLENSVSIEKENIYEALMTVLKFAEESNDVFSGVRLFRTIIEHKTNLGYDISEDSLTIAEANSEDVAAILDDLKELQNLFVNLGLIDYLVLNFIKHKKREVREQIILTFIALMQGGNRLAQERLFKVLCSDKSNIFMKCLYEFVSCVMGDIKVAMKQVCLNYFEDHLANVAEEMAKNQEIEEADAKQKEETIQEGKNEGEITKMNEFESFVAFTHGEAGAKTTRTNRADFESVQENRNDPFSENSPLISERSIPDKKEERASIRKLEFSGEKSVEEQNRLKKIRKEAKKRNPELVLLGCRLMKLLKNFCRNSFAELQNYLREQVINGSKVGNQNFLALTADSFSSFVKYVNGDCLDLGIDMLDFLIESVQGPCKKNQAVCSKMVVENSMVLFSKFPQTQDFETILLKRGIIKDASVNKVGFLLNTNIGLLASLVEGNDDPKVIKYFERTLKLEIVLEKMFQGYQNYVREVLKVKEPINVVNVAWKTKNVDFFDESTTESFNAFKLLSYMSEYSPAIQKNLKHLLDNGSPEVNHAYQFYENYTGRIEVILDDDKPLPYYFAMPPICDRFLELDKNKLLDKIPRTTIKEKQDVPFLTHFLIWNFFKAQGFISEISRYFDVILMDRKLEKIPPYITRRAVRIVRLVSSWFAFFMNLFFIFKLDKDYVSNSDDGSTNASELNRTSEFGAMSVLNFMRILGIIQIVLASLVLIMLVRNRREVIFRSYWRKRFLELIPEAKARQSSNISSFILKRQRVVASDADKKMEELLKRDPRSVKFQEIREILAFARNVEKEEQEHWIYIDFEFQSLICLLKDPMIFYAIFYLLTAFGGVLVSPVWYNLQLYDIVVVLL